MEGGPGGNGGGGLILASGRPHLPAPKQLAMVWSAHGRTAGAAVAPAACPAGIWCRHPSCSRPLPGSSTTGSRAGCVQSCTALRWPRSSSPTATRGVRGWLGGGMAVAAPRMPVAVTACLLCACNAVDGGLPSHHSCRITAIQPACALTLPRALPPPASSPQSPSSTSAPMTLLTTGWACAPCRWSWAATAWGTSSERALAPPPLRCVVLAAGDAMAGGRGPHPHLPAQGTVARRTSGVPAAAPAAQAALAAAPGVRAGTLMRW